jgi:hypothetical protein
VTLHSAGTATINGPVDAEGNVSLTTTDLLTLLGTVETTAGNIAVNAGTFDMNGSAKLLADLGDIGITAKLDAVLAAIEASEGTVTLHSAGTATINGPVNAEGSIALTAAARLVIAGAAETTAGEIRVDAQGLKMLNGSSLIADDGAVAIDTVGDALVTGIVSGSTDSAAVDITAGGHVLAGTANGRTDITADQPGAGVRIAAGLGVGDETEVDDKAADGPGDPPGSANAITAVPNPLRIRSAALDISTASGDIDFEALEAVTSATISAVTGNIDITADGAFHANLVAAPKGNVAIDANGDLTVDLLKAATLNLDSAGALTLPDLQIARSATLESNALSAHIQQVPSGPDPLVLDLEGYKGGVGTTAAVTVDAPAGLDVTMLKFVDSVLSANAARIAVDSAYVPGSFRLTSPFQTLFFNDRSPFPLPGSDVQLYQPGYAFSVLLDRYHTTSNAYVVQYDASAEVTDVLGGLSYDGISLIRDSIRFMREGDPSLGLDFFWIDESGKAKPVLTLGGNTVVIDGVSYPIATSGSGPAVNLGSTH